MERRVVRGFVCQTARSKSYIDGGWTQIPMPSGATEIRVLT